MEGRKREIRMNKETLFGTKYERGTKVTNLSELIVPQKTLVSPFVPAES